MSLPIFEFELGPNGCGAVKLNGEPLPGTVAFKVESKAMEPTRVHIDFLAEKVKFKAPVKFDSIDIVGTTDGVEVSSQDGSADRCKACGRIGADVTTWGDTAAGIARYVCQNHYCGLHWTVTRDK